MLNSKIINLTLATFIVALFAGCGAVPQPAKGDSFPKMYAEQPKSLLILPAMNETTDAEAKDYYMTTVEEPYANMGYYTFPVEIVSDVMKQEGVYDTEILYNMPTDKFREYFGADAVLFTTIKKWDTSYAVIASYLTVAIASKVVSTKTSDVLWSRTRYIKVNLSGNNSGGGLAGLLVNVVATAIKTATADYVTYARKVNKGIVYSLPAGAYHEMHNKDRDSTLVPKR